MDEKERIEKIMEAENLNSSQFAVEIGIQGSTLSHILNGRNKPSLDVLKKILNRFRTVNSDWLILGVGAMYRNSSQSQQAVLFDIKPETNTESGSYAEKEDEKVVSFSDKSRNLAHFNAENTTSTSKAITKVVVFYSDNTFEEIIK